MVKDIQERVADMREKTLEYLDGYRKAVVDLEQAVDFFGVDRVSEKLEDVIERQSEATAVVSMYAGVLLLQDEIKRGNTVLEREEEPENVIYTIEDVRNENNIKLFDTLESAKRGLTDYYTGRFPNVADAERKAWQEDKDYQFLPFTEYLTDVLAEKGLYNIKEIKEANNG